MTNSGRVSFIRGNALTLPLADQSVALICSSPPYWALRSYQDDGGHFDGQLGSEPTPHHFLANLWAVMDECWRVLRDDGSAWINLGDKFSGAGPQNAKGRLSSVGNSTHWGQVNPANTGIRSKSKFQLPHRFALGCQWPAYRHFEETQAGLEPTVDAPQWILRMDVVWAKPNGMPESVTDRCRASHEYWLHLVKSERYFAAIDEIREGFSADEKKSGAGWLDRAEGNVLGRKTEPNGGLRVQERNVLGKVPGSVWTVATEPLIVPPELGVDHFAAFPSEFPRRIVLGWSPSGVCVACGAPRRPVVEKRGSSWHNHDADAAAGLNQNGSERNKAWRARVAAGEDGTKITGYACSCPTPTAPTRPSVVLDPFSGTGTTAIVAAALGRHGIGVELSADYLRLARWRDEDGGLRCKALGVERPARQLDGQLSLLEQIAHLDPFPHADFDRLAELEAEEMRLREGGAA